MVCVTKHWIGISAVVVGLIFPPYTSSLSEIEYQPRAITDIPSRQLSPAKDTIWFRGRGVGGNGFRSVAPYSHSLPSFKDMTFVGLDLHHRDFPNRRQIDGIIIDYLLCSTSAKGPGFESGPRHVRSDFVIESMCTRLSTWIYGQFNFWKKYLTLYVGPRFGCDPGTSGPTNQICHTPLPKFTGSNPAWSMWDICQNLGLAGDFPQAPPLPPPMTTFYSKYSSVVITFI